jgi:transposase
MEAKESQRKEYLERIKSVKQEDLVYVDESGIDKCNYKNRGWGKKGKLLLGQASGKRYSRTNMIAAQCNKKILAPVTFQGSCNSRVFVAWIEQALVKELRPGQTVIMDNASFHKSPKIKDAIEGVGCNLVYLPPYSPDLNPIENFWANLKRWIRQNLSYMQDTHKAISFFFPSLTLAIPPGQYRPRKWSF